MRNTIIASTIGIYTHTHNTICITACSKIFQNTWLWGYKYKHILTKPDINHSQPKGSFNLWTSPNASRLYYASCCSVCDYCSSLRLKCRSLVEFKTSLVEFCMGFNKMKGHAPKFIFDFGYRIFGSRATQRRCRLCRGIQTILGFYDCVLSLAHVRVKYFEKLSPCPWTPKALWTLPHLHSPKKVAPHSYGRSGGVTHPHLPQSEGSALCSISSSSPSMSGDKKR